MTDCNHKLNPNTVYELSRSGGELPDHATLGTLRKIASAVGRKVVVRFEVVDEREIGNG